MPRKQADYPDWVMKYKEKGTYINKVGDKYYLYAAHSERVKGTGIPLKSLMSASLCLTARSPRKTVISI